MDISDAKSLSLLLYKPHYLKIFILNLPSGRKKAAAGQTIFHAQMNVSVAALSIRAAVSFCSSETFDDPNTV